LFRCHLRYCTVACRCFGENAGSVRSISGVKSVQSGAAVICACYQRKKGISISSN
jgi:hypothetical protein